MTLTVAISTHEGYARYLDRCARSARAYADEVLIYGDGWKPPGGIELPKTGYSTAARRKAIEEASCDYLLHLDGDDWLFRRPALEGDMCFSDMYLGDPEGVVTQMWDCSQLPTTPSGAWEFMYSRMGTPHGRNPIPGKCNYRTAWLRENSLSWYEWPNTTFGEDVRTIIEYIGHSPEVVYVPESPYYVYTQHEGQDTADRGRRLAFQQDMDAYLEEKKNGDRHSECE